MKKSFGYILENYLGVSVGFLIILIVNSQWKSFIFITDKDFYDKLIPICTTLFGFLLTILTLIIQSDSKAVLELKGKKSFGRLIKYNKKIVLLSMGISIVCLIMIFVSKLLVCELAIYLRYISLLNLFFFIWTIVDTITFVSLFYKLLLQDSK